MYRYKYNHVEGHFSENNIQGTSDHFRFCRISVLLLSCKSSSLFRFSDNHKREETWQIKVSSWIKDKHVSNLILTLEHIGLISDLTESSLCSQIGKYSWHWKAVRCIASNTHIDNFLLLLHLPFFDEGN